MGEEIKDRADIFGESFQDIKLSAKKISSAEFDDCTFINCDFSKSFFYSCTFRSCKFKNCDLTLAKFTDSKIGDCGFISSKLIGIDWTMCNWQSILSSEPLRFDSSILTGCNFFGLNLDGLQAIECVIKDADFTNSSLKNGIFKESDFHKTIFSNTQLQNADFTNAMNISMKISSNHFKDTKISHFNALSLLESEGIIVK